MWKETGRSCLMSVKLYQGLVRSKCSLLFLRVLLFLLSTFKREFTFTCSRKRAPHWQGQPCLLRRLGVGVRGRGAGIV